MNDWFASLSYKTRKRLALLILVLGLPAYIIVAVSVVSSLDRPSILTELAIYVGLGVLWAFPFRAIFRGIGQADPDE
ncbi:hypothetical protein AN189_16200 [Loktanella sp. 3ANDIMAR09]|uniref:DUF2842 domain-containing protein n=1 Tax=Loktanella sp. 3ANDIMAR09 TaxID=1225657 RepID=UPI0006F6003A|nr:DUF2842 domain-containing protein [Loktanella sp. 3ANDIMAR09]KQI67301.1 hypothetical protein AN189_16200 [Loktanella sp. 3ANDIMAR09]